MIPPEGRGMRFGIKIRREQIFTANKASPKVMNRTLGFGLAAMSIAMIIVNYV